MSSKDIQLNKTRMMRKLIALNESQDKGIKTLTESGTPTTALPPSTDAGRQMSQDMANTGKEGRPSPVGAVPGEKNAAQMPAILDPNGEDMPVQVQDMYKKQGETMGAQIPADLRPAVKGPASDTLAPGSDTSAGVEGEVAKAKAKSGLGIRLESATAAEIVDALIEHFGGTTEFVFALAADGAPFKLAEALAEGNVNYDEVDERIIARLYEMAVSLFGEPTETSVAESIAAVDADMLLGVLLDEGLGDTVKKAVDRIFKAGKKEPSAGYQKIKAEREKRMASKAADSRQGTNRVVSSTKRSWGV